MSSTLPPTTAPLQIHTTIASLRAARRPLLLAQHAVGFVPTMGALHDGHLSLLRQAAAENDALTVSIFVNPAQFAPTEDLATYPRTLAADVVLLQTLNASLAASSARGRVTALFLPSVAEMYPSGIPLQESLQRGAFVSVQPLGLKLEGGARPHFFRGVATVVNKLFNIVQPDRAYFGQKDVQQTIVLRRMVKDLHMPLDLRVCPTGRESDGLARSSRNVYLGEQRRRVAPVLYKALQACEQEYLRLKKLGPVSAQTVLECGRAVLAQANEMEPGVKVELEYLSLADTEELEELETVDPAQGAILSAAIRMLPAEEGQSVVRIIDNIIFEGGSK